jgi:hypothetical protein
VCPYCGGPHDGKGRCQVCKEKNNEAKSEMYTDRKARGVCVDCDGKHGPLVTATHCEHCRTSKNATARDRWLALKLAAFDAYGGPKCVGTRSNGKPCGESDVEILEIDHIDGGGNKHRKSIGQSNIYLWLEQQGYPDGYRVLCPTCNKKAHIAARKQEKTDG